MLGAPTENRRSCMACSVSFSIHREPYACFAGPHDASFVLVLNFEPQQIYVVGRPRGPMMAEHDILGYAHHACVDTSLALLAAGTYRPEADLGRVTLEDAAEWPRDIDDPPMPNTCPFCGQNGKLSPEHVWPSWVSRLLVAKLGGFTPRTSSPGVTRESIKITAPVCYDCNNLWMGSIESDTSSVLKRIVVPPGPVQVVSPEDQRRIAVWAYKTALMIEWGMSDRPLVPAYHYELLRIRRRVPKNARVWLGAYKGRQAVRAHLGYGQFGNSGSSPNAAVVTFCAFRALFQVLILFPWGTVNVSESGNDIASMFAREGMYDLTVPQDAPIDWPRNGTAFTDAEMDRLASRFENIRTSLLLPDGTEV